MNPVQFRFIRRLPTNNCNQFSAYQMTCRLGFFLTIVLSMNEGLGANPTRADEIDYARDVLPILAKKCYACHGPDEATREGGLALHLRESALGELDSGEHGIVPGNLEQSEIFRRITTDEEFEKMPPEDEGVPLTDKEVETIRQWIQQGAKYNLHWAYRALNNGAPPKLKDESWLRNPIDRYVLKRLQEHGLKPNDQASKRRLIRRLSLDLTGLPPTVEEIHQFLKDKSENAYEKLVDRLLASTAYGEHWARKWLDLARYADSQGYAQDEIRSIWQYRDWVIRALNADMPFDQFTIEQLAGDMLEQPTKEQLIATAFHRNTMTNTEGGTDDEEFRFAAVVDRTNTTMQVWMGTTMGCAQCHSHKYDPVSQKDYYRVFALLNQSADSDKPNNHPTIETPTENELKAKANLKKRVDELTEKVAGANDEAKKQLEAELKKIQQQLQRFRMTRTPVMQQLPQGKQRKTHIAIRGAFSQKGEQVDAGIPELFEMSTKSRVADRLELARWLVSENNALAARVVANRHWEQLFGRGIVETSEDFGTQGVQPSHPELLDWLALELIDKKWSLKQLNKTIVMSATYRQGAHISKDKLNKDPHNQLLSRGPRYRQSAEQIRDYALQVSGLLSRKMYGPPVKPPQPKSGLKAAFGGSLDWDPSAGEDRYRRGIYTLWRRTNPYPSMVALDATNRTTCTVRRIKTNTPVGVFVTLNDPVFVEAAQALARKIEQHDGSVESKIRFAFETVLSRQPSDIESKTIESLYSAEFDRFKNDPQNAKAMATSILGEVKDKKDYTELAAWTVVANALLNLDETLNN